MSTLTAAFNQSRRNLSARSIKPAGNIILKAKEFTDTTVKGEVMTGPAAGSEIEIKVPNNGGKSVGVKEFTKKGHKSFVDVDAGGTLRVEKVREGKDGVYDARWMRTFQGKPEDDHDVIYDAMAQLRTIKSSNPDNPDRMVMHLIFPEMVKEASSIDQLREELTAAFDAKNGAHIFFMEEGSIGTMSYGRSGQKVDDEWVYNDAAEEAQLVIDSFGDNLPLLEKALQEHAFSVVPSSRITVGSYTAEMISDAVEEARDKGEEPRISTIDPQKFKVMSTGVRVQIALMDQNPDNALPKDAADRLKDRFLATADEGAKEAFHKGGWRAVSNDDMRRFFDAVGVNVTEYQESGWSRQSVLLKNGLAIKAFGQDSAIPYPNLPVCKDAIAEFRTEIREAIRAVVDGPLKAAETEAPKVKADEAPKADAAPQTADTVSPEADIDDLDALLDGVQDADMGA
jgi:hypothetical protein